MHRLIVGSLSFLLMSIAITPAVRAETPSDNPFDATVEDLPSVENQTTPFNLVTLAYQGFFEKQGVPSAGGLLQAYRSGNISAEDLVQGAIETNRLSPEVLNDREYMAAVQSHLNIIVNNGSSY